MRTTLRISFIACILFLFSSITLFVAFKYGNILESKGQIGDFFGGILNPIIGILSAILLYETLIAQIKANKIQADLLYQEKLLREESEELSNFDKMISDVNNNIRDFRYYSNDDRLFDGIQALYYFSKHFANNKTGPYDLDKNQLIVDQIIMVLYKCEEISEYLLKMNNKNLPSALKRFTLQYNVIGKGINTITEAENRFVKLILKEVEEIKKTKEIIGKNVSNAEKL